MLSQRLISRNPAFLDEIQKIPLLAKSNSSVLISGETGTGKQVCARLIHDLSKRASRVFVEVNCGAIPAELAENELFGHRDGAFTGAIKVKHGLVHEAEKGTLFLDEVDSLPFSIQAKLLRFLQEKTYRPLGTTRERRANVRIIAAAGISREKILKSGRIRSDLYYRLNVLPLSLPPLRDRREDIPPLANHFLRKYSAESKKATAGISAAAMEKLCFYDWPGNIRELSHVIERAVAICEKQGIHAADIALPEVDRIKSLREAKDEFVLEFERRYIQNVLFSCQGNISRAARTVSKHRRAFFELIRKHEINADAFRQIRSLGEK